MMCGFGAIALLVIGGVIGFVLSPWDDDGRYRKRSPRQQQTKSVVEWRDVFPANNSFVVVNHRFFPNHYARVLAARGTRRIHEPV
jgi:hypothetical protein